VRRPAPARCLAACLAILACGAGEPAPAPPAEAPEPHANELNRAAAAGRADLVNALLARGADPNAPGVEGWTPLHEAAAHGRREAALALLDAGANPGFGTPSGFAPLDLAIQAGDADLAERCSPRRGVRPPPSRRLTPLHVAARQDLDELARILCPRRGRLGRGDSGGPRCTWPPPLRGHRRCC
jgi:ankyrin repeat protein